MRSMILLAAAALLAAPAAPAQDDAAALETISRRVLDEILAGDASAAEDLWKSMDSDGRWADLAAAEVSDQRLRRLEAMALGWARPGLPRTGDETLRDAILAGLEAWLDDDPRHSNWWVTQVAIPRALARVALVMERALPPEIEARIDRGLSRAWPPPRDPSGRGAAANLFYRVDAGVARAILDGDPGALRAVVERAAREIRVVRGDGIQADLSLHQHGPLFYTGSYGLEYARTAARLAVLVDGTSMALPAERIDLLVSFVLDGMAWIVRGPMIDPAAQGRNFSRKQSGEGALQIHAIARTLARLDHPRRAELEALGAGPRTTGEPLGNRVFWRSDFVAHRRPGWYASAKMLSTRTKGTESGNGEGLKQVHVADGACLVMRDGTEYAGLQPVWDWRRIPGITCEQDDDPLPLVDWGWGARGTTRFAGGVSDGRFGVAALDFDRDRVKARKAWFFLDDEVVCLGAGVSGSGDSPVFTTLDQRRRRGEVARPDGPGAWFHHDGIAWVVLGPVRVEVESTERSGDWRDVNRRYETSPARETVVAAWIDHGVRPAGATYAYAIVPGLAPGDVPAYAGRPPFEILANAPALQAIRHDALGVAGVVFHEAGRVDLGDGLAIAADRPCLVLVTGLGGEVEVSAANPAYAWPDREPFRLAIRLERDGRTREIVFDLEDGRTSRRVTPGPGE